ncbi:hypothetical protein BCV72DRAFT_260036 [Rhizopus microsporus var. microsporus]|uniref:Uncharacterized protein n=2 Tax=Rhizopus microsporus TaxID=58291 RepID=A0A2G4SPA8_RHIZD|nr:uncharacterized protein RHIMIDRAFT_314804 [Rhizopus microsporus ATCC 52813]ORE10554.1 hypothetical protein BCV72DRAFT_260036 [Rhizopus microsporus var. microsporus]PHZ10226.1 hypothetical protein RHIMIDRAFT_314804 [Rhizopus microsporus ATCC 52813]
MDYSYSEPVPYPSQSTPIHHSMSVYSETRPRRHTITRPDSAMALLSDIENEDEDDDREQQETFDRISGILSNLIQEANEAVQDIENERVHLLKKSKRTSKTPKVYTSSTILTKHNLDTKRTRRTRASHTPCVHVRNPSSSSTTSNNSTLFSPLSASSASSFSTTTTLSSSPPSVNKKLFRHTAFRPRQSPSVTGSQRRSTTPRTRKRSQTVQDTIMESFKRLDSSMALVDSLSRDLATTTEEDDKKSGPLDNSRMTLLLLIPLLHIPHSLITMIFDFCTSPTVSNRTSTSSILSSPSFSISSMVFWACVFTVTNLMVDQVAIIPKSWILSRTRRISLPGSYTIQSINSSSHSSSRNSISGSSNNNNSSNKSESKTIKRSWIPKSVHRQYQFQLGQTMEQPTLKRRNSI